MQLNQTQRNGLQILIELANNPVLERYYSEKWARFRAAYGKQAAEVFVFAITNYPKIQAYFEDKGK